MIHELPRLRLSSLAAPQGVCIYRTVSREGHISCVKIVEGDCAVSPSICHNCPFETSGCAHLCFSLVQTSPSPLVVRYHGRTEVWDDDRPRIQFRQAACAVLLKAIDDPRVCAACSLREEPQHRSPGRSAPSHRREPAARGKVVPFAQPSPLTGDAAR